MSQDRQTPAFNESAAMDAYRIGRTRGRQARNAAYVFDPSDFKVTSFYALGYLHGYEENQ